MFIDLHCHPAMKPLGKSFLKESTRFVNSPNRKQKNSIWFRDKPQDLEKELNKAITLTKFTQADLTTLAKGDVKVVCASLYPLEKGFVKTRVGDGNLADALVGFVTGLSKNRLDHLSNMTSYYDDMVKELEFYLQLDHKKVTLDEGVFEYRIVKNFDELEANVESEQNIISIIVSIEGGHTLDCGLDLSKDTADLNIVIANVEKIKGWDCKPFFITLAHHFYNELCGHAKSFSGISALLLNQKRKIRTGITPLGRDVIDLLLDNTSGNRILIDLKHMSDLGREEYYEILNSSYPNDTIPLVVSHGAMNGLKSYKNNRYSKFSTARKMMTKPINFYDEEIVKIAESGGIFGLQFDERRVASKGEIKAIKKKERRGDAAFYRSKLIWNNIQHAAEVLDERGMDAWDTLGIGSDFDGIIDPVNEFWTASHLERLENQLQKHAYNYMNDQGGKIQSRNQLNPMEIVEKLMSTNAYDFLSRNFI